MAVKKVSKDRLVKAAEELNEVLGLEPAIDVEQEGEELEEAILEASELLEPEDELSKATLKVINDLIGLAEAEEEQAATTDEEEEEESEPAVEEKEDAPAPKKESKPAPKKPAPKAGERKMTRPQALVKALMLTDGPFTAEQIVESSHKIYEAANRVREEHMRGAKAEWDVVNRAFLAVGVLEVNEETKPRTFTYTGRRE